MASNTAHDIAAAAPQQAHAFVSRYFPFQILKQRLKAATSLCPKRIETVGNNAQTLENRLWYTCGFQTVLMTPMLRRAV